MKVYQYKPYDKWQTETEYSATVLLHIAPTFPAFPKLCAYVIFMAIKPVFLTRSFCTPLCSSSFITFVLHRVLVCLGAERTSIYPDSVSSLLHLAFIKDRML